MSSTRYCIHHLTFQITVQREFVLERINYIILKKRKGIYAPVTPNGRIIVNGILASCYSEFNDQTIQNTYYSVSFYCNFIDKRLLSVHFKATEEFLRTEELARRDDYWIAVFLGDLQGTFRFFTPTQESKLIKRALCNKNVCTARVLFPKTKVLKQAKNIQSSLTNPLFFFSNKTSTYCIQ